MARRIRRSPSFWGPILVGLWLALCPRLSAAQSDEELQTARDKFENALALQTGGDWAGALSLLKEVARVRSTPHVRFNIALCEEHLGQLVGALGDYELAVEDAKNSEIEGAEKVATEAKRRMADLNARIPRLTITRGRGSEAATVSLDGVTLGDAILGTALNVDPGPHVVKAAALGFVTFTETVRLEEGQTREVALVLTPLPKVIVGPAPPEKEKPSHTAIYVSGGVAVAAFGAAGAFYFLTQQTKKKLDSRCTARVCAESDRSLYTQGKRYTLLTNAGLAVGALGTAAGLFFVLSLDGEPEGQALVLRAPDSVAGFSYLRRF